MQYKFVGDSIYVADDDADCNDASAFSEFAPKFETVKKIVDLITGDETLQICLHMPYKKKLFLMDRENIKENKIFDALTMQGFSALESDTSKTLLKTIIVDTEAEAPIEFRHDKLGYRRIDNKPCFLAYHPVGEFSKREKRSVYKDVSFEPKGSMKALRKFIMDEVVKRPQLCLVTALGVSASVAFFLKEEGIFTDTLIWGLVGDSSIGKSTLLEYIGGQTASPQKYVRNFNSTMNAIPALIRLQQGMCTILDEASYNSTLDFDSLLYTIPDGKDKLKCTPTGELRETEDFTGALIFASEHSILERTVQNPGQKARLIEFNLAWFDDGDQAERMRQFCSMNYGWVSPKIAKVLLQEGMQKKLRKKYRAYYKYFISAFSDMTSGVDRRLMQRLAVIMTSAWVFEKAMQIGLGRKKLVRLLKTIFKDVHKKVVVSDKTEELIESIEGFIRKNSSKFPSESVLNPKSKRHSNADAWGFKCYYQNVQSVWIEKETFQELIRKYSSMGLYTSLEKLHKKNRLVRFYNERFCVYPDSGMTDVKCYCFILEKNPTLMQSIGVLKSGDRNLKSLGKVINADTFGQDNYEINITETKNNEYRVGFMYLGAQTCDMVLNKPLTKCLGFKAADKKMFLTILPDSGVLMLSKHRLLDNSVQISIEVLSGEVWSNANVNAVREVLNIYNIKIEMYTRLLLTDVEIHNEHGAVALVKIKNTVCSWQGALCADDPKSIEDITSSEIKKYKNCSPQRCLLLSEEDTEE